MSAELQPQRPFCVDLNYSSHPQCIHQYCGRQNWDKNKIRYPNFTAGRLEAIFQEIPIGMLTALLGTPIFGVLLWRFQNRGWAEG